MIFFLIWMRELYLTTFGLLNKTPSHTIIKHERDRTILNITLDLYLSYI